MERHSVSNSNITVAEYFAGIGLVKMGLEKNGFKVIFANDNSTKKYAMYSSFYPEDHRHYVIKDIFELDIKEIPLTTLATCSFPCVDLSVAGNMLGINGKHSSAFWGFLNILEKQGKNSPSVIMIENVVGWLSSNSGKDFRLTVKALNELGYYCDVFVLDALRFVPQSRKRIFLIGMKSKGKTNNFENYFIREKSLAPKYLTEILFNNKDLLWCFLTIPNPPKIKDEGLSKLIEVLDENDFRWWSKQEVDKHIAMMNSKHLMLIDKLKNKQGLSYRTFFRRMRKHKQYAEVRKNDTSGCLRTATGGSSKQFIIQAGDCSIKMRKMTPREYARLQGVTDNYQITVQDNQAITGLGDATCVDVVSWIAENVLLPLF